MWRISAGLLVLAAFCGAAGWAYTDARQRYLDEYPDRVRVRWTPDTPRQVRIRSERRLGLSERERTDPRTWSYVISDSSPEALRRLVEAAGVEDTQGIDRQLFQLSDPVVVPSSVLARASIRYGVVAALLAALGVAMVAARASITIGLKLLWEAILRAAGSLAGLAARIVVRAWRLLEARSFAIAFGGGLAGALLVVWVTRTWRIDDLPPWMNRPSALAPAVLSAAVVVALALGIRREVLVKGNSASVLARGLAILPPGAAMLGAAAAVLAMTTVPGLGGSNLSEALYFSDAAAVHELMVVHGADPNQRCDLVLGFVSDERVAVLPLEAALLSGDDVMVRMILEWGARPEFVDPERIACAIRDHGQERAAMLRRVAELWPAALPLEAVCETDPGQW